MSLPVTNVVLVHGGFVDGSGWQGVYDLLTADGFKVSIVQHATFSLAGTVSAPAWRTKPSWYLVAADDRMIPPPAQRAMAERATATTVESTGSHAVYVSEPAAVADLIKTAAQSVG
ncbi:alpha/beta hydrolase [Streptomyces hyaluromycini]|uniref:Alpha/beta hydrolase n=1 Tax=Streptomyces hyaluromycini TaxID=1377993 RepID=A0ABV1WT61_9ACTN